MSHRLRVTGFEQLRDNGNASKPATMILKYFFFNGTPYLGKITHIRKDTDGELIYGVTYSDNDYEEYNFKQIMEILQAYNPLDDIDDVLEVIPFFGSSTY